LEGIVDGAIRLQPTTISWLTEPQIIPKFSLAYLCTLVVYLFKRGFRSADRAFAFAVMRCLEKKMNAQRLNVIREVLANSPVASQDELRRKLRRRGIHVTQATLSRDIHHLRLSKGPGGYSLPNGHRATAIAAAAEADQPPTLNEMIDSLGLRVRQAMNQVVLRTVMGGAQPVAAALDREEWPEVVGTIAGDDTVLIICTDVRHASEVDARLRTMVEV
jgi:transcriptional regulator of arginine metabolism